MRVRVYRSSYPYGVELGKNGGGKCSEQMRVYRVLPGIFYLLELSALSVCRIVARLWPSFLVVNLFMVVVYPGCG